MNEKFESQIYGSLRLGIGSKYYVLFLNEAMLMIFGDVIFSPIIIFLVWRSNVVVTKRMCKPSKLIALHCSTHVFTHTKVMLNISHIKQSKMVMSCCDQKEILKNGECNLVFKVIVHSRWVLGRLVVVWVKQVIRWIETQGSSVILTIISLNV